MDNNSLASVQQEIVEVKKENHALKETVAKLLAEIQRLHDIKRSPRQEPLESTPEARIIQLQIESYEAMATDRQLTLEEIRAVDLLIKNQKLLNEAKPKEAEDVVPDTENVVDLIRIAGNGEQFAEQPVEKPKRRDKQKTSSKDPLE